MTGDAYSYSPVLLIFRSRETEKQYRIYTSEKHRHFYLAGIILSL